MRITLASKKEGAKNYRDKNAYAVLKGIMNKSLSLCNSGLFLMLTIK